MFPQFTIPHGGVLQLPQSNPKNGIKLFASRARCTITQKYEIRVTEELQIQFVNINFHRDNTCLSSIGHNKNMRDFPLTRHK